MSKVMEQHERVAELGSHQEGIMEQKVVFTHEVNRRKSEGFGEAESRPSPMIGAHKNG